MTECQCKMCVRAPVSRGGQEEMCDRCCDMAIFTCGTGRQKQKIALIVSPRFHLPPRCSTHSFRAQSTSLTRRHKHNTCSDNNHAHTSILIGFSIFCKTVVTLKSALLTINCPCRREYFQTVQQSQEKQSCCPHVGHGAQHCCLS